MTDTHSESGTIEIERWRAALAAIWFTWTGFIIGGGYIMLKYGVMPF